MVIYKNQKKIVRHKNFDNDVTMQITKRVILLIDLIDIV